ncbi:ArgR family transcriptional regulator, partial [Escherichia coli]
MNHSHIIKCEKYHQVIINKRCIMKEYDDYSAKEKKQLAVCQRLITEKSYLSQEEIRRDLQN